MKVGLLKTLEPNCVSDLLKKGFGLDSKMRIETKHGQEMFGVLFMNSCRKLGRYKRSTLVWARTLALLKPTFCRVPIDSISGFVRTCKKVRYYGSLRHHVCTPGLQQPERNQSYQPRRGADSQPVGFAARCALVYLKDEKNPKRL